MNEEALDASCMTETQKIQFWSPKGEVASLASRAAPPKRMVVPPCGWGCPPYGREHPLHAPNTTSTPIVWCRIITHNFRLRTNSPYINDKLWRELLHSPIVENGNKVSTWNA